MKRHGVVTLPRKTTSNGVQKSNLQTRGDKQRSPDIHVGEKVTNNGALRFAYADPPYIGCAKKHYNSDEVDHKQLIQKLMDNYDGWALSCHSPSLKMLLPLCPATARVMAWVKPFCSFKPYVNPAYAWEPVIVYGGRARGRKKPTIRDWVSVNITLKKGLCGAKPKEFCFWLFEVLGMEPFDELEDLFPGTGIITECWKEYCELFQQGLKR